MRKCPNCKTRVVQCISVPFAWYCPMCNFVYQRKGSRYDVVGEGKTTKKR